MVVAKHAVNVRLRESEHRHCASRRLAVRLDKLSQNRGPGTSGIRSIVNQESSCRWDVGMRNKVERVGKASLVLSLVRTYGVRNRRSVLSVLHPLARASVNSRSC